MRLPHFIGAYVDLDGDGIFGVGPATMPDMLNPSLLTFPIEGEYKEQIDEGENFTPRPFKCTIAKAIEWMFRVRKWSVQLEIPSGPGSEFGPITFDLNHGNAGTNTVVDLGDEKGIIDFINEGSGRGWTQYQFFGSPVVADAGDRSYTATVVLDLFRRVFDFESLGFEIEPYQVGNCTNPDADEMLVSMQVRIAIQVYDNVTGESWNANVESWDGNEYGGDYVDEGVTIDGHNMLMRWPHIGGVWIAPDSYYLESAPYVTISPVQWWEYSDGASPIWNASTGAQLRSVITGEPI